MTTPPPPPQPDAASAEALPPYFFVIDVESVGLHGEAFAVGWAVFSSKGAHYEEGFLACPMEAASGSDEDRAWCLANIPAIPSNRTTPLAIREAFWPIWMLWKAEGAVMVADCAWPVEARFLASCVDGWSNRKWEGPYPLHDVASVLLACGKDPLKNYERTPEEFPKHHPMKDARQSGRILVEALKELAPLRARLATLEAENAALKAKAELAGELAEAVNQLLDSPSALQNTNLDILGEEYARRKSARKALARFDATEGRKT